MCGATVPHHAADSSRARWVEAMTRQDGATLGYDLTGRSYATHLLPRRKTDGMGYTMRHLRHHYPRPAFNALAFVLGLGYPGATCWALGHSVTIQPWAIKGRTDDRNRQTLLGKFNPRLEQHTHQYNNSLRRRRVLRSGGPNHINHRVHPA
jgi:hypothetical protein